MLQVRGKNTHMPPPPTVLVVSHHNQLIIASPPNSVSEQRELGSNCSNSYCIRSITGLHDFFAHCRAVFIFGRVRRSFQQHVSSGTHEGYESSRSFIASSGAALLGSLTKRVPCRTAWPRFSSTLSLRLASSSSKCRRHHTGCLQPLDLLHIRQSRRKGWAYGLSYSARGYVGSSTAGEKPLGFPADRQVNQRGSHPLSPEGGNISNETKCST